jgi:NAD(P)-dependent dehydrogenase (short-subunit alcohol dehydrogenase family)
MGNSHPNWGFASTASEIVAGVDLGGQRAIVTGASAGIGLATARALASVGAEVTLAVRSEHAYDLELAEMLVARAARLIA